MSGCERRVGDLNILGYACVCLWSGLRRGIGGTPATISISGKSGSCGNGGKPGLGVFLDRMVGVPLVAKSGSSSDQCPSTKYFYKAADVRLILVDAPLPQINRISFSLLRDVISA